ncbi:alpha-D-ribose 1-methylphosphonate 5-triphosphate diphosphatase [Tropicimonas sediminicola]|uniref:Alpha-D-ribose 1-methylphosphonate 5-triphosphate diphosphatase n=1 Tax=Tropicimonas sediminicola TaxID=1031541 RepID=A0A239FAE7_9RHOB|nr:alpha-D-ribose 1-methylphosphonate 5-triphosphate diphosphatase [Tropicimonas sediminicola]SNS53054.1 alpha-D-ribose 1-methylphosphonate 5-triphosphate diphosphatase [Tropicimonas sediminicola]
MHTALPPVRLTGAHILRDGAIQRRSLAIADGRITKGPLPEVDMRGYLLLPGIIDLNGNALARNLWPEPHDDLKRVLSAIDRDAAAHGVTTGWLAQGWSWEGGTEGPDFAERLLATHLARQPTLGTDLRLQLRCETHLLGTADRMLAAIRRHGVDFVLFDNRLEQALEMARCNPEAFAVRARRACRTPSDLRDGIEEMLARHSEVPRHLCRLAEAFDVLGVCYGSKADPDGETRETYSMIGASIAAMPGSRQAAAAAKAMNDPVILSAHDVLFGGKKTGGTRPVDLVAQHLCDALVSDDHYPSLAAAAWALVDRGLRSLPDAWTMISSGPAEIMRLTDRGTLDFGKRADVVAVNTRTREVEMTIAGGVVTHLGEGAARRFAGFNAMLDMAAE